MSGILSLVDFQNAARAASGWNDIEFLSQYYAGASLAARSVLPRIPKLGFFSGSTERTQVFLDTCCHIDLLIEAGEIDDNDAQMAILLLNYSDNNFHRALAAFVKYAYPFRGRPIASNSPTATRYFETL